MYEAYIMWKNEGYMASGQKLVNVFSNASKAFNDAYKAFRECV